MEQVQNEIDQKKIAEAEAIEEEDAIEQEIIEEEEEGSEDLEDDGMLQEEVMGGMALADMVGGYGDGNETGLCALILASISTL